MDQYMLLNTGGRHTLNGYHGYSHIPSPQQLTAALFFLQRMPWPVTRHSMVATQQLQQICREQSQSQGTPTDHTPHLVALHCYYTQANARQML